MTDNTKNTGPKKIQSCGGNACPDCGKCRDWYRSHHSWHKHDGATCSGTVRTDTDDRPDGDGSTRTYVEGHGHATGWDVTGSTCTRDNHGGRMGPGVYTVVRGTAEASKGHPDLCACDD